MKKVVLVACGAKKLDSSQKAKDLYIGSVFKRNWKEIESEYPDSDKYIISSKYGLVDANQIIDPYEQNYPDKEKDLDKWAQQVVNDLLKNGFDPKNDELVIYAAKRIGQAIVKCFPELKNYTIISIDWFGKRYVWTGSKP